MSASKPEVNLWGIHAGEAGDADSLFLKNNCIAICWTKMGDLSALKNTREAFKAKVAEAYPEKKPGAIRNNAGQLFRFVYEMKTNDFIAYPSKQDRQIHLGRVESGYTFDPAADQRYPHKRTVKWLRAVPRTQFTQGALYEIGSAMTLFLIKNFADEYFVAMEGKVTTVTPVAHDVTVAAVAEDIEDTTRDFILKKLSQELKGNPLEGFVVHLLECMGYHARLTKKNEPSVDIIAYKDHLGIEPPIIKVQVKSGDGTTADKDVSALYGKLSQGEYGLFVTLSTFSPSSRNFAQAKGNLRLIDGDELVDLILQHYENFDALHKGLLPLRRLYVPEAIEREEE